MEPTEFTVVVWLKNEREKTCHCQNRIWNERRQGISFHRQFVSRSTTGRLAVEPGRPNSLGSVTVIRGDDPAVERLLGATWGAQDPKTGPDKIISLVTMFVATS